MKLDSTPRRTFKVQVLLIKGSSEDPSSPYTVLQDGQFAVLITDICF